MGQAYYQEATRGGGSRSEAGTPAGGEGNLPLSVEGAVLNRENPRASG